MGNEGKGPVRRSGRERVRSGMVKTGVDDTYASETNGGADPAEFFERVAGVIEEARKFVGRTADLTMCVTYFSIGHMIVEREQRGKGRAGYGQELIRDLSKFLTERFKKGFSATNLRNARLFYKTYSARLQKEVISDSSEKSQTMSDQLRDMLDRSIYQTVSDELPKSSGDPIGQKFSARSQEKQEGRIQQTMSTKLPGLGGSSIGQAMLGQFPMIHNEPIGQTLSARSQERQEGRIQQTISAELLEKRNGPIGQTMFAQFGDRELMKHAARFFKLGWTHYLILMRIKNEDERRFYEIEAEREGWSYSFLKRQYHSSLYERLALSKNKDEVMRLAREGQTVEKPEDILKSPLVLEFLGMKESAAYSETELEAALISKLQDFLLELGKGYLFEARQKRFTFDGRSFFVDLVLYNRLLQCFVLIDLKTEELKHQDLGQMQMYVNYYDRFVKKDFERPSVGFLLCKKTDDSIVELTLPPDAQIYASEYSLYLPDKEMLQRKLAEWEQEFEEERGIAGRARGEK